MGKGKGSGPGRPRRELPSKAELLQQLMATKDNAKGLQELAEQYGCSTSTIRRRLNDQDQDVPAGTAAKTSSRHEPPSVLRITNPQPGVAAIGASPQFPPPPPPPAPVEPSVPELDEEDEDVTKGNTILFEDDYTYNKDTDTYITFLTTAPKPVLMSGTKHRAMQRAYSNWDGQPASINEICRTFDIPRAWFIEYKNIHGWTHDSEPFTHEELRDRPVKEMVQESLQLKRQAIFRRFEKAKWRDTQAAAEKWWDFEQSVLIPLFEKIENFAPTYKPPMLTLPERNNDFAVVFAAFDVHYGRGAWRDETGFGYTRAECRELLLKHTATLAADVARFGRPEQVIVPVGSDWFNVDNPWNETANGTRQDMDGTYAQMIMEGTELAVEYIDLLRQIAPVSIITVDGNHDRSSALTMGMYLRAWYRNMPDVTCVVKPSPRQYVEYGNSLLGFCHGDDIKVGQLPALMASEARESWGRTQLRNWFTGHLHHEVTRDLDGVTQYQLPSLAGADRWSSRKGFCLSKRALTAYVIDHEVGNRAVLTSPILKEIPYGFKMPGTSYRTTAA